MTLCKERDALAAQLTVRPARRELVVHPNRNSWRPDPWDHFCGSASGSNFGFASFRGWLPPRTRSMFFSTCGSELSDKARACPSSHEREVRRPAKLVLTIGIAGCIGLADLPQEFSVTGAFRNSSDRSVVLM